MLQGPCACGATHSIEEWDLKKTHGQKIVDRLRVFSEDLESGQGPDKSGQKVSREDYKHLFSKLTQCQLDADGLPLKVDTEYEYMGNWVTVRDFGPGWCAIEGRFGDVGECHPNDLKRKK
jgi:hypothetical protein